MNIKKGFMLINSSQRKYNPEKEETPIIAYLVWGFALLIGTLELTFLFMLFVNGKLQ